MINFLITSICCQIVLLAIYKLGLEGAKMPRSNRIYLLSSLLFSLSLPFVSIEIQSETVVRQAPQLVTGPMLFEPSALPAPQQQPDSVLLAIWLIYGLGVLFFLVRFTRNLARLSSKISNNTVERRDGATVVLLESPTLPHTFLHYIFVNAQEYRRHGIEEELFTHELAHARQNHSLDILFVEILRTIFWFNPVLALYAKAMRINHEFLADDAVVTRHESISYQQLLLSKAHPANTFMLASSFHYSITKKRMLMMTKTISPIKQAARTLVATLAFAALFGFFGIDAVAQAGSIPPPPPPPSAPRDSKTTGSYYSNTTFHIKKSDGTKEIKRFDELSSEQIGMLPPPPPRISRTKLSEKQFQQMRQPSLYAVWIDGKPVKTSELKKYKASDFAMTLTSRVHKNARSKKYPQPNQANLYTEKGFSRLEAETYPQVLEWHFDAKGSSVLKFDGDNTARTQAAAGAVEAVPNQRASFPGGFEKFYAFFNSEFKPPADFSGKERLIIKFTIEADGKTSNAEAVRASTESLGKEAVRVILKSPDWIPATENGNAVKSEFHLPIAVKGE